MSHMWDTWKTDNFFEANWCLNFNCTDVIINKDTEYLEFP